MEGESMEEKELIALAQQQLQHSYAPYSGFRVGAALLAKSGKVYVGCNIENAAFPVTVCAERVALFSAVAAGERAFSKLAVVGGKDGVLTDFCYPCGSCRQVLSEFCSAGLEILLFNGTAVQKSTLGWLMPHPFK